MSRAPFTCCPLHPLPKSSIPGTLELGGGYYFILDLAAEEESA